MIIIGDVHGNYKTLKALLRKLPKDNICFVGDLIDRGPNSCKVVELVKSNGYPCVMGNHEYMMLDSQSGYQAEELWIINGGDKTLKSYKKETAKLNEHLAWMEKLPLFLQFPDLKIGDRSLIVSHSTIGNTWERASIKPDEFVEDVLWGRNLPPKDVPGIYNVFGHTIVKGAQVLQHFAMIDTGCFLKHTVGVGYLTAVQFPEMKLFTQENID